MRWPRTASELTLLDVGTGGADIPLALLARAGRRGRGARRSSGIDSRPEVLAAAVVARPAVAATPGLELHVGDGRSLPYADGSFDVVHASMVLHHLPPDEAVAPAPRDGVASRGWASSSTTSTGAGSAGSARG